MEVTPDEDEAWRWMKRANRQRFAPAQFHISRWYREGFRTEVDIERADELLSRAAEQGYIPAMFEMGMRMLDSGDIDLAIEYINEAYEQKYPLALKLADYLATKQAGSIVEEGVTTDSTVLRDEPTDENTLVIYGSRDKPEVLFVDLLQDMKEMGVYDQRGATGSRLGDTKCGEPGSGCKSYKVDSATIEYDLRRLIRNR
jgi:TPR repeat protein